MKCNNTCMYACVSVSSCTTQSLCVWVCLHMYMYGVCFYPYCITMPLVMCACINMWLRSLGSSYPFVQVCNCVYVHICIYMGVPASPGGPIPFPHVCICMYASVYLPILCLCVYVYVCVTWYNPIPLYICTHVFVHICGSVVITLCICVHVYIFDVRFPVSSGVSQSLCACVYMHMHLYTSVICVPWYYPSFCTCMHINT